MSNDSKTVSISQEKSHEKPENPPIEYLEIIFGRCPNAGELYMKLWRAADKNYHIRYPRKEAPEQFTTHPLAFKCYLNQLSNVGLLSHFTNHNDILKIELVGWQDGLY